MGLFQDSLKKWFYTNNSSAASSDARVPLLNADGSPKGSDTMANLASVLGGQNKLITFAYMSSTKLENTKQVAETVVSYLQNNSRIHTGYSFEGVIDSQTAAYHVFGYMISEERYGSITVQSYKGGIDSGIFDYFVLFGGVVSDARNIAFNIPTFYKNYQNESALATALGGTPSYDYSLGAGESKDVFSWPSSGVRGGLYLVTEIMGRGYFSLYLLGKNSVTLIKTSSDANNSQLVLTSDLQKVTLTNNDNIALGGSVYAIAYR